MEESNILLSVIILSYNEKQYISQAIESCLSQKVNFTYEIIIADDGSNDGSEIVIHNYCEKNQNISYFIQKRENLVKNQLIPSIRVSNNIKKALSMAKGKYTQILSADDFFVGTQKFSNAVEFLEKNPKYIAYVCNYQKYYNTKAPVSNKLSDIPNSLYWAYDYCHISCYIFRKKEVYNSLLNLFCDDTGLEYSIILNGKIKYSKEIMFSYRQRENSIMSSSNSLELYLLEILLFQDCLEIINRRYYYSSLSRYYIAFKVIYKNRNLLCDEKYMKYFQLSESFKFDYLNLLKEYNELSIIKKIMIKKMLFKMFISNLFYHALLIFYKIIKPNYLK